MGSFNYKNLKNKKWGNEIIAYLVQIHEHKVKQELFLKVNSNKFTRLIEIGKIESIKTSNQIEGIKTTSTRLKQIISEKTTPKNRDEEEIAGYKDALNTIHESYKYIPITSNYILQLHKILYKYSKSRTGGTFKNVQNYISGVNSEGKTYTIFTPLSPFETPAAIENICDEFNKAIVENEVDPLILIPIFIHDFLCIHPFLDGNGRMSRLLTTLLLYKSGYFVGKYISLEAKIAKTKSFYYQALKESQTNWDIGKDNSESFIKYLLGIIIAAYRDFEERVNIVSSNSLAIETVKKAISVIIGKFTKSQIAELCPNLSIKSIESSLKKLVDQNYIQKQGTGKNTYYIIKDRSRE